MDRLMAMQVYRAVVSSGSFTRAASMLRVSTASVSRHVTDLERHLGTVLLRRSSRALLMTESGKLYYERCCDILDRIADVEEQASQRRSVINGRLRVSLPAAFGARYVAPILPVFMERHPGVEVDVWCSDEFIDFAESGFDVAVRITRQVDPSLVAKKLAPIRHVVVASPAYLNAHGNPESPDELREHDCLSYAYAATDARWCFHKNGGELSVPIRNIFRSNCGEILRYACVAGRGIAIQPTFLVEGDLRAGRLVELFSDYALAEYNCYAVYPADNRNCARVRAFVDFLCEELEIASA